jgi:PAS domain S-box-containing protein
MSRGRSADYVLAVLTLLAAVLLRSLLDPWLGDYLPFSTLFGAIAVAVWLGGAGPAFVISMVGFFVCDWLFQEPRGHVGPISSQRLVGLLVYSISCSIIIGLGESMREARRRAEESRDDAQRAADQRARTEDALRRRTEELEQLLAVLPVAVWVAEDPECRSVRGNPAAQRLLGLTPEASFPASWPADEQPPIRPVQDGRAIAAADLPLQQAVTNDCAVENFELELELPDGRAINLLCNSVPLHDVYGGVRGGVAAGLDVSVLKAIERRLRESESRFQMLAESVPVHVWMDDGGAMGFVNQRHLEYTGLPSEALSSDAWASVLHPEDRESFLAGYGAAFAAQVEHRAEARLRRHDGVYRWFEIFGCPRFQGEQFAGYVGISIDISDRKEAQDALRASELAFKDSEERYRTLAEGMPFFIWQTDPDGRFEYMNPFLTGYTGFSLENMNDQGWASALHPDDRSRVLPYWERALQTGEPIDIEHRTRRKADGEYRWFRGIGVPVRDEQGRIAKWVGATVDIHDERIAADALRDADRRKDEFLATLAHELRNPLAPILNSLHVLRAEGPSDPQLDALRDVIERQVGQMARLLDDLLDVGRISRNRFELRKSRVALASVIESAIETSSPWLERGGHSLELELPRDPVFLDADPVRLGQVFSNVLNNAANYTPDPSVIRISAEREGRGLVIRVRDNGIGIAADMLPHVFEMFSRAEPALARSRGGLGIGLSLARNLVELHGGTIEGHSAGAGMGSEFVVRLPIATNDETRVAAPRGPEQPARVRPCRILVIDDLADSADSLAILLRAMGHDAHVAYDGEEGIAAAQKLAPEVIVLDIGMPKMNGYETCRYIRKQPWGQDIHLVALTGWGQTNDRIRTEDAGFDCHLVKPVDPAELSNVLARWFGDR